MADRGRVLLALPQGGGKTPLTVAAVESLAERWEDVQGIVIAQGVLKYQWAKEISKFTGGHPVRGGRYVGGADVVVIDGPKDKRAEGYRLARNGWQEGGRTIRPRYVILGYDQIVDDYQAVDRLELDFAVGDEITLIKGAGAARSQALKTIRPDVIYGLSGDPIENAAEELFSIMEWIDPTVLGPWEMYDRTYIERHPQKKYVLRYKNLDVLHRVMESAQAWFVMDENDPDIAQYLPTMLPPITEYVELDKKSAELYERVAAELQVELAEIARKRRSVSVAQLYAGNADTPNEMGKAAARLLALRMICAHPYVARQSGRRYEKGEPGKGSTRGSAYAAALLPDLKELDRTPKLDRLIEVLDKILDADPKNKVVVFSFFKDLLRCVEAQYEGEAIVHTGDMTAKQKDAAKRRFQTDPGIRLFLSSDAGGYGVDLPQANYLVNYDVPFSAGLARQRNTRIRRASSLDYWSEVQVINILVSGSLEEYYADRTDLKQKLGEAVRNGRRNLRAVTMSVSSLSEWLASNKV